MRTSDRVFVVAGVLAVIDTLYVTWRYLVLHAQWVTPRTGFCSWTREPFLIFPQGIDCDPVLLSPQARAFYVPNATLGLGFFLGCLVFHQLTVRRGDARVQSIATVLLAGWLSLASVFTFRFYSLLVHLPTLCPVCPWNHLLTWVMNGAILVRLARTPKPLEGFSLRPVAAQAAVGVGIFVAAQMLWVIPWVLGRLTP